MERRTRSRAVASAAPPATNPEVRKTKRNTRQNTVPASVVSAPNQSQQSRTAMATPVAKPRLAPSGQIPHRGARLSRRAESIASMATSRPKADDDTDFGDETQLYSDQLQVTRSLERGMDHNDDGADDDEELIQHQVRDISLDDLDKASDDVMNLLKEPTFDSGLYKAMLKVKYDALEGIRRLYQDPEGGSFINWIQLVEMYENPNDAESAAAVMVRANITTALGHLRRAQFGNQEELFTLFDKLNALFPQLFTTSDSAPENSTLVLDIRTWLFIELVVAQEGRPVDSLEVIAHVFCLPDESDYFHRFSHGPFRSLWGESNGEHDLLCADRIKEILSAGKKDKKTHGVDKLREAFPLAELLEDLDIWFTAMYDSLGEPSSSQHGLLPDAPTNEEHSAVGGGEDFEIEDSQTDIGESQSIIRAGTADEEPTLYQNPTSLRYLDGRVTSNTPVPPSNQQQSVPPPGAPQDYGNHRNSELLRTPPPNSSAFVPSRAQGNGEGPSRKRPRDEDGAPEGQLDDFPEDYGGGVEAEEDDEDEFETDTRPVDKGKRAAISTSMPPPKRPRITAPPQSSHPVPPTSSRQPPPPSSATSATPDPSQPDFTALKTTKDLISRQYRLSQQQPFKQRHPWSDHDCALLIELISERHAAWASIEKNDRERFQIARGQQAYRDKARNLKVDYLMTDVVLPPCFDLVALGKKEIDRLIGLGKNPYRREADVDENGFAIGTEYKQRRKGKVGEGADDDEEEEEVAPATTN